MSHSLTLFFSVRRNQVTCMLFLAGVLSYAELSAQTSENPYEENFRERCRKIISGTFAESYNENFRAQDAAKLADRTLKRLAPQETLLNQELAKIEKKIKAGNYDPKLTERRDQLIAQIRLYHEQVVVQEEIAMTSKKSAESASQKYKDLEIQVKQIFNVAFVPDPEGAPRNLFHQLTWKSPCPKFRSLCPLPANDVAILKSLTKKVVDTDKDCEKYSSLK